MPFALNDLYRVHDCIIHYYAGKVEGVLESLSTSCQLKVNNFYSLYGSKKNKFYDQSYSEQVPLEVRISTGKNWAGLLAMSE